MGYVRHAGRVARSSNNYLWLLGLEYAKFSLHEKWNNWPHPYRTVIAKRIKHHSPPDDTPLGLTLAFHGRDITYKIQIHSMNSIIPWRMTNVLASAAFTVLYGKGRGQVIKFTNSEWNSKYHLRPDLTVLYDELLTSDSVGFMHNDGTVAVLHDEIFTNYRQTLIPAVSIRRINPLYENCMWYIIYTYIYIYTYICLVIFKFAVTRQYRSICLIVLI